MIKICKINKLREVNFKILHRILAVPLVVAGAHKQPNLSECAWCGERASIDHILLTCSQSNQLYAWVSLRLDQKFSLVQCIFSGTNVDLVIWVTNFAIYKAHLMAVDGLGTNLFSVAIDLFHLYKSHFPCLDVLCSQ